MSAAAFGVAGGVVAAICVLAAAALAWRVLRALVPDVAEIAAGRGRWWIAGAIVLCLPGITWGWPGGLWAVDELNPTSVLAALEVRWSGGWFEVYPPLHYYVLGFLALPVAAAGDLAGFGWYSAPTMAIVHLQARSVSVVMAVGALVLLATLAARLAGRRAAWPAAACAALFLPFVYYAKTANLEVPYLFWFVLSLTYYESAVTRGRTRDVIGLAVSSALAVGTKDQAYALYVLPLAYLAWRAARVQLASAAAAGVAVLLVVHNVAFNWEGFTGHLGLIVGSASQDYRMVPSTLEGQWTLLRLTGRLLGWGLGWAGFALVVAGLMPGRGRLALPAWWWLPALSYCATFILVVGYAYDRFFLPVLLILAVPAGAGWVRLRGGWPVRGVGRGASMVLAAVLIWRAASVNALLIGDSRYDVEAWLEQHAPAGSVVAGLSSHGYLPRMSRYRFVEVRPTVESTIAAGPEFVVVNQEFVNRYSPDAAPQTWLKWLESPESPFVERLRVKSPLRGSTLRWWPVFTDRQQSPLTNLDKANPEVVVFSRRPGR